MTLSIIPVKPAGGNQMSKNAVAASFAAIVLMLCTVTIPAAAQGSNAFTIGPIAARGNDADRLLLGLGAFNIDNRRNGGDVAANGELEYRFGWKLPFLGSFIGPTIGAMATSDGGAQGYGGVYADFAWGHWIVSPLAAVGAWHQGDSKDLGGVLSFRLALDAGYEFDSGSRLGLRFAHISNAWTHARNPGEEELLITYSIPLFEARPRGAAR
jgi:hypothetical protein